MLLEEIRREQFIRKTLHKLARQRVAMILQSDNVNVWVIENSLPNDDRTEVALRTCHMRGWVEPLSSAIPRGVLTEQGTLPEDFEFSDYGPLYRLTEAGWNAIHRIHGWVIGTFIVALGTFIVGIVTLVITLMR